MITGVGIDVVEIPRLKEMEARWGARFVERIFTEEEITYCSAKSNRAESLAVRFAAKEAFSKALGTGWDADFQWKDFSIRTLAGGKPVAVLSASMHGRLQNTRIHLSLSHSDHYAAAVVILEEAESTR
jgi:holo-[acyl-carrier protein] synthase